MKNLDLKLTVILCFAFVLFTLKTNSQMVTGGYNNAPVPKEIKASAITGGSYSGDVNLFNGAYNSNYSLGTVKTPGGLSFNLMLNYGSTCVVGDNPVVSSGIPYGEGWNLSLPTITIQVEPYQKEGECDLKFGVNFYVNDQNVQEFTRQELAKEGNLFWYSPTVSIPGVINERFVFKHFDINNHDAVFVPARFEKYVEARLKGNNTWVVILDDGSQYHFTYPVINYRTASNQRFDVNALSDLDNHHISPSVIANLVLPKAEVTTWYCNVISNLNHAKGQNIFFEYEAFGKFSYFSEFDQQSFLATNIKDITGWSLATGNLLGVNNVNNYTDEAELTPLFGQFVYYKDILLKSVSAVTDISIEAEKIILNYSTVVDYNETDPSARNADNSKFILYSQTNNYLAINEPGVVRKDSLYNVKNVYNLDPLIDDWTRFYHFRAPEVVGMYSTGNYVNPIAEGVFNPYLFNDGGDTKAYAKKITGGLTFNHGYLQSNKIGTNFPPGDLYEIKTEITDNNTNGYKRWANFDINLFTGAADIDLLTSGLPSTGNPAEISFGGNTSISTVDDYSSVNIFNTFNNGIKWCMNGDGLNEEVKSSNFFVMPNLPPDFGGFNISVGAANSDNLFTSDPGNSGGMQLSVANNRYNAFQTYANYQTNSGARWYNDNFGSPQQGIIEPCDKIPAFFGVGLPWYIMSDWMFLVDNNPSNYIGNSSGGIDEWLNNDGIMPSGNGNYDFWHSRLSTVENIPTRLDENFELFNVEVKRYSKNAYMLTSVEKYVTNGEIGKPQFYHPNTKPGLIKVSRIEMDYTISLDEIANNIRADYTSAIGASQPNGNTGFMRNVFLLEEIRRVAVDPTKNNISFISNVSTCPKTKFEYYEKQVDINNFHRLIGLPFTTRFPFCNRSIYLLVKSTDEIGSITEIEYDDLIIGAEKYRLGFTAQSYFYHRSWTTAPPVQIMNDPTVIQLYSTVKNKKVVSGTNSLREWEYEFMPGNSNSNLALKRELKTATSLQFGSVCALYDIMGTHFEPHNLNWDFGFKTTKVYEPEITPGAGRNYTTYYHDDNYSTFGKLYKVEKRNATNQLNTVTTIDYVLQEAYVKPPAPDNIVQMEDGLVNSYGYDALENKHYDVISASVGDYQEFLENAFSDLFNDNYLKSYFVKKEKETTRTYQPLLTTNLPRTFTPVGTSGVNSINTNNTIYCNDPNDRAEEDAQVAYIDNIKEYKYFDAERIGTNSDFGTSNCAGYVNLIPGFASNSNRLVGEASWQVFSVKEYSPQLPAESKTTEYYYYFDIGGLYNIYNTAFNDQLESEFKELYYLHKKNVRNAPFQKRVITEKPGEATKTESEYYVYSTKYTTEEVYSDQPWTYSETHFNSSPCPPPPPPPPPPPTGSDPCAIYQGGGSQGLSCVRWTGVPPPVIPPGLHYCGGSWYLCNDNVSIGRAAPGTSLEYQHFGDMFEFEYDIVDSTNNSIALREIYIPLERRALLKEVYRLVTEVANPDYASNTVLHKTTVPLMRFEYIPDPTDPNTTSPRTITRAVMPFETLKETDVIMYNPHGQVKKIADAKDLVTYYKYDGRGNIRYRDDGGCITEFMESEVYNNVAVPISVTVGYGLADAVTTNYEYWPDYSVKKITQPNGEYISYEFDEFGRLKNTIDNGKLVAQNTYSQWQNTVTDFYDKAKENFVESKMLVNAGSNAGTISRAYVDPLGRAYNSLSYTSNDVFGNINPTSLVYDGENVYDEWDRLQIKYAPFIYNGTATPAVPRFNTLEGINTYFKHITYENNFFSRSLDVFQNGNYPSGPKGQNQYGIVGGLRFCYETGLNQAMHNILMPTGNTTNYIYSKNVTTDEDDKTTVTYSNAMGQKVAVMQQIDGSTSAVTLYVYDSRGNVIKTINPERQETNYYYNQLGRVWKKETVDQRDGNGNIVPSYYIYDKAGNVIIENDAICSRYYEYDLYGRKTFQGKVFSYPDYCGGSTDPLFSERKSNDWLYEYECSAGLMLTRSQVFIGSIPEKKWFYDIPNHDPLTLKYHPAARRYLQHSRTNLKGRLSHTISYNEDKYAEPHQYYEKPVLYTFYSYNGDGDMKWEIQQFNPDGITDDNKGIPVRIDYFDYTLQGSLGTKNVDVNCDGKLDFQTHYVYDLRNRLQSVFANYNNLKAAGNKIAQYAYDDATGLLINNKHYTNGNILGEFGNRYDIRNRLTGIESEIYEEDLHYDASNPTGNTHFHENYNGNINAIKHSYPLVGATNPPANFGNYTLHSYNYDGINRLVLAQNTGAVVTQNLSEGSESYTYDKIGNIFTLNRLEIGSTTPVNLSYGYLAGTNRLLTAGNNIYTYDPNGNLLTDNLREINSIHYGRANLPLYFTQGNNNISLTPPFISNINSIDYLYNCDDKRIFKRTIGGAIMEEEEGVLTGNNEFYLTDATGALTGIDDMAQGLWTWYINGRQLEAKTRPEPAQQPDPNLNDVSRYEELNQNADVINDLLDAFNLSESMGFTYPDTLYYCEFGNGARSYFLYSTISSLPGANYTVLNRQAITDDETLLTIFNTDSEAVQVTVNELREQQDIIAPDPGAFAAMSDPFYNAYTYFDDTQLNTTQLTYYIYDHLGNTRVTYTPTGNMIGTVAEYEVKGVFDYYPYGKIMRQFMGGDGEKFLITGNERDIETGLDYFNARFLDCEIYRFVQVDPLASQTPAWTPYRYGYCNPVGFIDPSGLSEDWVQDSDGNIKWDKDANSQATTKSGETYLGKTLTFEFNSFIDEQLWDGPGGSIPCGDKLTSTIKLTGLENSAGELTGIDATKQVKIGETPIGTARDFYPGLGEGQNKFTYGQTKNSDGTLSSHTINFEQHGSVSRIEEFGLNSLGYDIVNVAQKLTTNYSNGNLSVNSFTDVFPSATLKMNGNQMMHYAQPSFKESHSPKSNGYKQATWYKR
ncbi:MAG TPA: RHS repeat-associated core domain-containing protein [Bacteroidia bacterium]|nr:RHS repeat-associated core domain-containing protein [Bacteroidia bacterium]